VLVVTVMMGLRRRVRIVASLKGDFSFEVDIEVRRLWIGRVVGEGGEVVGGVGGRRSLAASQSSSMNWVR
jgi:hypothetical protein